MILSVDGQPVNDETTLNYRVATKKPGERIALELRDGKAARTVQVKLQTPPGGPSDQRVLQGNQPLSGATAATLTPALADKLGLNPFLAGVVVIDPGQGFPARAGFQKGDVVVELNGKPVRSVSALAAALASSQGWRMTIDRGGKQIAAQF